MASVYFRDRRGFMQIVEFVQLHAVPAPLVSQCNCFKLRRYFRLRLASRNSQLNNVSANGSSLLTLRLAGYTGVISPFARYFLIVFLESPVRLVISRIASWSRWCQRQITLNKSTSITPQYLLQSCPQEKAYTWIIFGCKSTA